MNDPAPIPVMERLGADLQRAMSKRPPRRVWWRAHPVLAAGVALSVGAVPAVATQVRFADLVKGETALPTQAPTAAQVVLAEGAKHSYASWRLVAYRARLAGQPAGEKAGGVCVYVRQYQGGLGRCVPDDPFPGLVVGSMGSSSGVIAGLVSPAANRVDVTLRDGRRVAVAPQATSVQKTERAGLPSGIRFFVVETAGPGTIEATGMLVRDGAGREIARSGRPSPIPAGSATVQSPVKLVPEQEAP